MNVPLYAANACYFIVLAVFPALLLLLGLLSQTPLEVEQLAELFYELLPESLAERAEELILLTYDNLSGTLMGISAATALWSAGRGIYGVLKGLNGIYGVTEEPGYFHSRAISAVYMIAFLLMLLLTLGLHIFSVRLELLLYGSTHPALRFLGSAVDLRFLLLLLLQTLFFAVMFAMVPGERNSIRQSLPGALLAALGWQIFSDLYSVYMERFSPLSNVYGSVYAVAMSMLWLYFCISIVFYGAALNVLLSTGEMWTER